MAGLAQIPVYLHVQTLTQGQYVCEEGEVTAYEGILLGAVLAISPLRALPAEQPGNLGLPSSAHARDAQSPEVVRLGRRLFFDQRLSRNGHVACATCHEPERAFTDALAVGIGIEGRKGTRNTPTVVNAALHETHFWDGRRQTLEEQVLDPFVNPAEHGLPDDSALLAQLRADSAYRGDFERAYPASDDALTLPHVANALAAFIRSLAAGGSDFDRCAANHEMRAWVM